MHIPGRQQSGIKLTNALLLGHSNHLKKNCCSKIFAMSLQINVSNIFPDGDVDKRLTPSTFAWLPSMYFYDLKQRGCPV
jgi:hypothetical protein